jgi:hypothetical protein
MLRKNMLLGILLLLLAPLLAHCGPAPTAETEEEISSPMLESESPTATPTSRATVPASPTPEAPSATSSAVAAVPESIAYESPVLGVQLLDTAGLQVVEDEVTRRGTYGFSLSERAGESESRFILRIVMMPDAPTDVQQAAEELRAQYPELPIQQEEVVVDGREGMMLYTVPGADPNTYLYVVANDQLYQIIYAKEELDVFGQELLDNLRFVTPTQSLASLGLPDANTAAFRKPAVSPPPKRPFNNPQMPTTHHGNWAQSERQSD